jgi:iron complex outermembrane recepter protein
MNRLFWIRTSAGAGGLLFLCAAFCADPEVQDLPSVVVRGGRPTSIPTNIPTTTEGITAERIEQTVNATDSSDALKYFPSLVVRKRYAGDFDHAVLATRASGTGNSARSLVYADGILLSNLLGNGAAFTPRWGLVTPEEIDRVDVLYGPFSAAYPGNSVGAVVDYLTRMPTQFEAHAKIGVSSQRFDLNSNRGTYRGSQGSVSLGSSHGPWAWWVGADRQTNQGQPLVFANRLLSTTNATSTDTVVSGAVIGLDPRNRPWVLLGSNSQIDTTQDHVKVKLAYSISSTVKLSYVFGSWQNNVSRFSSTYLRDAAGNPVYSGNVSINGMRYTLAAADFPLQKQYLEHQMHGLTLKSNTKSNFDYELTASQYRYSKDDNRVTQTVLPAAADGGAGRLTSLAGTGWTTLSLKGTWRSGDSLQSAHSIDFGVQKDRFQLRSTTLDTAEWKDGAGVATFAGSTGSTQLSSAFIQDTWRILPTFRSSLGLRYETWKANNGSITNATSTVGLNERQESYLSPKAALAYDLNAQTTIKTSFGRSVRFPTVSELYQGSISGAVVLSNDPNLKPERANTQELSAEYAVDQGLLRATIFRETSRDALYSQTNVLVTPNVTNVQNVDLIKTLGIELAANKDDAFMKGLSFSGSVTYSDSKTIVNSKFPASVGAWQPRVPQWRANAVASYQWDEHLSGSFGLRYSGKQFATLDNVDTNPNAYTGFSSYFVADTRIRYRFTKNWIGSAGIDNLTNAKYWAFHPYPQRTLFLNLKYQIR